MFDNENKPINVVAPIDVSHYLSHKDIVDNIIEVATDYDNDEINSIETTEKEDEELKDVNAFQEDMKSIHIFFLTKNSLHRQQ